MKHFLLFLLGAFVFITFSCKNSSPANQVQTDVKDTSNQSSKVFAVYQNEILKDYETWYSYYYYRIHLSQDFIGLDVDSNKISKASFLQQLSTGSVVPFNIQTSDDVPVYKLYPLHATDSSIQSTIQQAAQNETFNYEMEGKKLPDFDFTDINNNRYNKANTKGKIIVLKCWFIKCVACVKEFPELNELVNEYKNRNDILFVSLAPDSKEALVSFLKKKPFEYAVVPDQRNYIDEKLKLYEFPTHLLINKNGTIVKVTNSISEIIPFIKKETGKS